MVQTWCYTATPITDRWKVERPPESPCTTWRSHCCRRNNHHLRIACLTYKRLTDGPRRTSAVKHLVRFVQISSEMQFPLRFLRAALKCSTPMRDQSYAVKFNATTHSRSKNGTDLSDRRRLR